MGTTYNQQHFGNGSSPNLRQVERYPQLDRARELELARRYLEHGDRRAGDEVICAHLRDVVAIARGYRGYGQPLPDLIAAGNLGLVRALERFEPARRLRFMTYASYFVRAAILEHVVSSWSAVGVGKSSIQRRLFFGLRQARARLEAAGVRDASLEFALAEEFRCSSERVRAMLQRLEQRDVSFDLLFDDRCDDPERELLARESKRRSEAQVRRGLAGLDPRERMIIERRFFAEDRSSLSELGLEMGISRQRVRQLECRAKAKIERRLDPAPG